ncbi:MAG: hypothetical protein WEB78_03750 [Ilumatobacteraceae bacterium]
MTDRARRIAAGTGSDPALRAAIGGFAAAVVRQDDVDPITTELVRIRCAHHHDCGT